MHSEEASQADEEVRKEGRNKTGIIQIEMEASSYSWSFYLYWFLGTMNDIYKGIAPVNTPQAAVSLMYRGSPLLWAKPIATGTGSSTNESKINSYFKKEHQTWHTVIHSCCPVYVLQYVIFTAIGIPSNNCLSLLEWILPGGRGGRLECFQSEVHQFVGHFQFIKLMIKTNNLKHTINNTLII